MTKNKQYRKTDSKSMEKVKKDKKYVLSNSESVQCNFFILDNVTFIQVKICCCVQNFMKIG